MCVCVQCLTEGGRAAVCEGRGRAAAPACLSRAACAPKRTLARALTSHYHHHQPTNQPNSPQQKPKSRVLRRKIKKTAMVWVRVTPNVPVTSKPAEVRMGKGKGAVDYYAAAVRPGQILFEIDNIGRAAAAAAVAAVQPKMPIRVGVVEWR